MFKVMAQASVTQAGPQCWLYWEIGFDFRNTIECFVIILCEMVHGLPKLCVACRLTERVLEDDCVYAMCEAVKVLELVVCWPAVTWGEEDLGGAGPREWQGRGECQLKVAVNRKVLKVRGGLGDGSVIQVTWSGCLEWGGLEEWWVEIWWSMSSKQTIKVWFFAILTSGHGTYIKNDTVLSSFVIISDAQENGLMTLFRIKHVWPPHFYVQSTGTPFLLFIHPQPVPLIELSIHNAFKACKASAIVPGCANF